ARDFVQVVVVELLPYRVEGGLEIAEVHDPARLLGDIAADADAHHEGVSVQTGTLVALRHEGQAVSGFEGEFLIDFHDSDQTSSQRRHGTGGCVPSTGRMTYNPATHNNKQMLMYSLMRFFSKGTGVP